MRGDFQAGKKYLSDRGWTETGIYILHQIPIWGHICLIITISIEKIYYLLLTRYLCQWLLVLWISSMWQYSQSGLPIGKLAQKKNVYMELACLLYYRISNFVARLFVETIVYGNESNKNTFFKNLFVIVIIAQYLSRESSAFFSVSFLENISQAIMGRPP